MKYRIHHIQLIVIMLCLASLATLSFCKSARMAKIPRPAEQYESRQDTPVISTLTIPVDIPMDVLVRSLNERLSGQALYEDYSYTDNDNDGLMLNAWKDGDITLSLLGDALKYRVPLKIWLKKKLVFGTAAEAEARLALNFKTVFHLNNDWTISTQTTVEWYEWLKNPVLKTGIGDISVETIGNIALNRSKQMLAKALDDYVAQQINLRPYVQSAWTAIQAPVLLDSIYEMWSKTTPVSIGMTPITTWGNSIRTKIAVGCINDVTFGKTPAFRTNSFLPDLNLIAEAPDDFIMQFSTDVPFAEAERLAKNMMLGQEFASGKNKVKVENIQLWGDNDKVVVNTLLSGSFNGNIYFIGKPEYNPQKNMVEVKDLDYHFDTRNFLLRSASWLFQGPIKKRMAAAFAFPLEENINTIKTSAQASLSHYVIQPGVVLTGVVDSVAVEGVHVTPGSIRVNLYSKGKVNVLVNGL